VRVAGLECDDEAGDDKDDWRRAITNTSSFDWLPKLLPRMRLL
jgi:hypothetical protein